MRKSKESYFVLLFTFFQEFSNKQLDVSDVSARLQNGLLLLGVLHVELETSFRPHVLLADDAAEDPFLAFQHVR